MGLGHLQPELALVGWHGIVHCVREQQVWLAGLNAQFKDFLPDLAGVDLAQWLAGFWRQKLELVIILDRFHERIGDVDAMVQVERLPVEVTGWFAHFQKFFNFRVVGRRDKQAAEPRRSDPWLIARVRLSMTRMKGIMPLVWPLLPTFSPIERTLPQ